MTRNAWGARYFAPSPEQRLGDLPLSQDAASLLQSIGLPTGPPAALQLCLRFETVNITHRPAALHLLAAAGLEIGPAFPRTGQPELDTWIDLRNFVVLGEVPNDSEPGPWFRTRLLCVDGTRGNVCWVYQALSKRQCTDCDLLNSSLTGYLGSLLAYKQFREEWSALLSRYPDHDEETPIEDPPYVAVRDHSPAVPRASARGRSVELQGRLLGEPRLE